MPSIKSEPQLHHIAGAEILKEMLDDASQNPTNVTGSGDSAKTSPAATETRVWSLDKDRKQKLPNGNIIDWNRGLLPQFHKFDHHYSEWWIKHPKLGRLRMFDNNFLESLSFTPWWVVPATYIPWGLLELRSGIMDGYEAGIGGLPHIIALLVVFTLGALAWSLFEYLCHRFAFHWEPWNHASRIVHFIGHGMHHVTPVDPYRLVFPPVVSVPLGLMFRTLYYSTIPGVGFAAAFYGGYIVGYASYESTHFTSHHVEADDGWLYWRYYYHAKHHFDKTKQDKLYGVSSQIWDHVFGTF